VPPNGMIQLWECVEKEWNVIDGQVLSESDREYAQAHSSCAKSQRWIYQVLINTMFSHLKLSATKPMQWIPCKD